MGKDRVGHPATVSAIERLGDWNWGAVAHPVAPMRGCGGCLGDDMIKGDEQR
jgi:hypothetical protein